MKKTVLLFLICAAFLCLFSCDGNTAPEGMQLCRGGEKYGYDFYVPEGWTLSYFGDIAGAYVTAVNPTSVTLAAIEPETADKSDYFDMHKGEFPYAITEVAVGEKITFGNATDAESFLYTYEYDTHAFRCLQIIASYGERTYLFTYNSFDEPYEDSEETCYEHYFTYVKDIFTSVNFYAKGSEAAADFEKDGDGYAKVTDKTVNRFDLWMAPSFTLYSADGAVTMKHADGATVVMTQATSTGMPVNEYFENRKTDLTGFVTELSVIRENEVTDFGNAKNACIYEYTYQYQGESMHVLQIIAVAKNRGYVFTYTAPEAVYETYVSDVLRMAEKVTF